MNGVKDQQISDAGSLLRRKSTLPDMQLCEDRRLMAGCRRSRAAASRMRNMKRPGLSVGQLWGNPTGGSGSFRASRRVCSPAASRVEASGIDSSRSSVRAVEGGCANETCRALFGDDRPRRWTAKGCGRPPQRSQGGAAGEARRGGHERRWLPAALGRHDLHPHSRERNDRPAYFSLSSPMRSIDVPAPVDSSPAFE